MINTVVETFKRWRLPIVCFAWLFSLLGLLMRRGYETFLAANFLPILVLAILALLPMTLCAFIRRSPPRFGMREALAAATVLLPLVYIHQAVGTTLGSGALHVRYVGTGAIGNERNSAEEGIGTGETSLLTLYLEADKYEGRRITLVGRLAKENPQVVEMLGEAQPLLFRFVINCCAADASPVALVLEGDGAESLRDDDWIEATGTFRIRKVERYELLVLEKATIRATKAPPQPYLYMQWGIL